MVLQKVIYVTLLLLATLVYVNFPRVRKIMVYLYTCCIIII
jgi:hypothetical protein